MRQQPRNALGIFARQQNLRNDVDLSGAGVDVPVQNVVLAAGGESDGQGFAFPCQLNDSRRAEIFLEEIIPGFQHDAVHQHDGACHVASFGKLRGRAHADIHHPRGRRLQCWSPRNRVRKHVKLHRSDHDRLRCRLPPKRLGW